MNKYLDASSTELADTAAFSDDPLTQALGEHLLSRLFELSDVTAQVQRYQQVVPELKAEIERLTAALAEKENKLMTPTIPEGFMSHFGFGRSLRADVPVDVICKNGKTINGSTAGLLSLGSSDWWNWEHDHIEDGFQIIAYRVIQP